MSEQLVKLQEWFEERNPRERILIGISVLAAIFGLFDRTLLATIAEERAAIIAEIETVESEIREVGEQGRRLGQGRVDDPGAALQSRSVSLEAQIETLDQRLAGETIQLISPDQMAGVFEDLLRRSRKLKLIRLETLSPTTVFKTTPSDQQEDAAAETAIFAHGLILELEGNYQSTLSYLREIEALPWHLFWDRLEYRVLEHPTARVLIQVHTLSTKEGWLRV